MKKTLLIAAVSAVALAGCCCKRDYRETAEVPVRNVPECASHYDIHDGGQYVYSEHCQRQVAYQNRPVRAVHDCGQTSACGFVVQKVQVSQPTIVTKRKYVVIPVNY